MIHPKPGDRIGVTRWGGSAPGARGIPLGLRGTVIAVEEVAMSMTVRFDNGVIEFVYLISDEWSLVNLEEESALTTRLARLGADEFALEVVPEILKASRALVNAFEEHPTRREHLEAAIERLQKLSEQEET